MSDYSAAILFLSAHKDIASDYLGDDAYLLQLSDMWLCRLSKDDYSDIAENNYSQIVMNLSERIPLLHVIYSEDDGCWLGILHDRKLILRFGVLYGCGCEFAETIGKELYGGSFIDTILYSEDKKHLYEINNRVFREIRKRHSEIDEKIHSFFAEINEDSLKQFGLFGFVQDDFDKIKNILTVENYQKDGLGYQLIEELFSVLKLDDFHFIEYNYFENDSME